MRGRLGRDRWCSMPPRDRGLPCRPAVIDLVEFAVIDSLLPIEHAAQPTDVPRWALLALYLPREPVNLQNVGRAR